MMRTLCSSLVVMAALVGCNSGPAVVNVTLPGRQQPTTLSPLDMSATETVTRAIRVTPTMGLTTTAAGGKATFTIVLTSAPAATVSIGLSSSDPTQGTVSPDRVSFGITDWNVARTVTVTGVDDGIVNGDHAYSIITAPATSVDLGYNGLNAADVSVTNIETDVAGFTITPTSGLTTKAGTATASFTVRLNTIPSANVTLGLSSSNTAQGTINVASLTFTPATWNVPQTVTITGVDDQIANGDQPFTIVTAPATSTDTTYNGIDPPDVMVTNIDTDVAGFVVKPTTGLQTTKAGGQATFTIRLTSKPVGTVSVALTSSNPSEGSVTAVPVSFNGTTWATDQTVTVTGVNDNKVTGPVAYTIVTAPATAASDPPYMGLNPPDVSVTNQDTNVATILVSTGSITTRECGATSTSTTWCPNGTASFKLTLSSQPTAPVTIPLSVTNCSPGVNVSCAQLSATSVVLDATNWNTGLPAVVVTGVETNTIIDGTHTYSITFGAPSTTDPNYKAVAPPSPIAGSNLDDDVAVYGGVLGNPASQVWCSPKTTCPAAGGNLAVNLPVGASVNFYVNNAGDPHGATSTEPGPPAWWPNNTVILDVDSKPSLWIVTPPGPAGTAHPFWCWVHTSMMTGTLTVQ